MNERNDVFKRFHDTFSKMKGPFHVLEPRVPVETQSEFFAYVNQIRQDNKKLTEEVVQRAKEEVADPQTSWEHKRHALALLATSKHVSSFRFLEDYVQHPDPDLTDWACMALMGSRMALEAELLDERCFYISSGLGGKGEKMRFDIVIVSVAEEPLQVYQRQIVERECSFFLTKEDCEIERLAISERHVEMLVLMPLRCDVKGALGRVVKECNVYGNFLSEMFVMSNAKEFTAEEIDHIIKANGDGKASN